MPRTKKNQSSTSKSVAQPPTSRARGKNGLPTGDYRHAAKTKNLPPAGIAAQGKLEWPPKIQYA